MWNKYSLSFDTLIRLFILNYIKSLLLHFFSYIFNFLISHTKKKNRFLFVSFSGGYYDNLKYFSEYVEKNHSNNEVIWLASGCMREYTGKSYPIYSIRGFYYLLSSSRVIVNGWSNLFSYIHFSNDVCIVQLWHGLPIRCVGKDDKWISKNELHRMLKCAKQWSIFTTTGISSIDYISKAFSLNDNVVKATGFARFDAFINEKKSSMMDMKHHLGLSDFDEVILYAPTWRPYNDKYELDYEKFNNILIEINQVLIVKEHPNSNKISKNNYSNIIFDLYDVDIQDLLMLSDVLITDYSSITVDFSFLGKRTIFFCYDYDKYLSEVGLYINLKSEFPADFTQKLDDLLDKLKCRNIELENLSNSNYKYHDLLDENNSSRIFLEIENYLSTLSNE